MSASNILRVRLCADCGELASSMDTVCPRCLRHGTLRDRFQCQKCRSLLEEPYCSICSDRAAIQEGVGSPAAGPRVLDEGTAVPNVAKSEPPAWLAGAVGGAFFGAIAGAVGGSLLGENPSLGALIGLLPGAIAGGLLSSSARDSR